MPSMSYCMFENTTMEMGQCLDRLEQIINGEYSFSKLNEYEQRAFKLLAQQCQEFTALMGEFEGAVYDEVTD